MVGGAREWMALIIFTDSKGIRVGFISLECDLSFGVICDGKHGVILFKVVISIIFNLPPEPVPSLDTYAKLLLGVSFHM